MDGQIYGWMNELLDGQINESWMDWWMDGLMVLRVIDKFYFCQEVVIKKHISRSSQQGIWRDIFDFSLKKGMRWESWYTDVTKFGLKINNGNCNLQREGEERNISTQTHVTEVCSVTSKFVWDDFICNIMYTLMS